MRIRELVAQKKQIDLVVIGPNAALSDAARIMSEHNIGALPVIDQSGELEIPV